MNPRLPRTEFRTELVTFSTPPGVEGGLTTAAAAAPVVDLDERTVEGLVVPFGPAGYTSDGLLTFKPGSLTWASDVRRVKLLREHDQRDSVGHAIELREVAEPVPGIWGKFKVRSGPEGDRVLAEFDELVRDGFSVGAQLDAGTHDRLSKARPGQAVAGSGHLRETSTVSIPAFDDARGGRRMVASAGGLTTMTTPNPTPPAEPGNPTPAPGDPAPVDPNVPNPNPPASPAPTQAAAGLTSAAAGGQTTASGGPAHVRAAAGAAMTAASIGSEPATYTLDGRGASLVRDAARARFLGDTEAAARMARFNAELATGNPSSLYHVTRAMASAAGGVGGLTTAAPGDPIASPALTDNVSIPASFLPGRQEALREAIDAGRPIISRLQKITLTDATPFRVPREGEFSGVGVHTEGTAHVAAGTLTLRDAPVMPEAMSGYYELSRELADASNPAIDRIAMRAMLRDYRRKTEELVVDAIEAVGASVGNVDTAMELRAALVDFVDDDGFGADFVAVSKTLLAELYGDVDTTGRPMIATGANAPSATTGRAGYTGAGIDGIEIVRAPRLTAGLGVALRGDDVLFGESAVQQFRFEEIKGPGIIALALWAYVAFAILDESGVLVISTGAVEG